MGNPITANISRVLQMPRHERLPRLLRKIANHYLDHQRRGVFHIGAHEGGEATFYGNRPVIWFEANPELMPGLLRSIAPFPKQRAINALLGDHEEVVDFNVSGGSSSIFKFGPYSVGPQSLWPEYDLRTEKTVRLQMRRLDDVLATNGICAADYDYWVMDVQGAELLVLKGATESLRQCKVILTEISTVEVYEGGARYDDLRAYLGTIGFVPLMEPESGMQHGDVTFVHHSLGRSPYFRILLAAVARSKRTSQ